jgi:hypothetical protein
MRANHADIESPVAGGSPAHHPRALARLLTLTAALCALLLCVSTLGTSAASADSSYAGMLSGGTLSIASPGLSITGYETYAGSPGPVAASNVWQQYSWSAPNSTQFAGFAYTGAWFEAEDTEPTGGLSIGFKGSGGSAPTDLNFPWTYDCAISEYSSPRTWAATGGPVGENDTAPGGIQGYCSTNGDTGGWNYTNAEVESTNPGINPQTEYQTLTFQGWCARNATCNDAAGAQVTNLSGLVDDPYDAPSGGATWGGTDDGSSWYQTNNGTPVLSVSAYDPGGVCALGVDWQGPGNYYSQVTNDNPGMENPGAPIGNEFDSVTPCGGGSASGSVAMPGGIASGTYGITVVGSNPGNWAGGAGLSNAPAIASYANTINVDNIPVSASLQNPTGSGNWTTATTATVDVTTGPSGLQSLGCTDNGSNVGVTLQSSGGDSYVYSVPLASGVNDYACSASNNDVDGALAASTGTQVYQQDSVVPTISYSDAGYTANTWTSDPQTISVHATGGPSGITGLSCTLDGNTLPDSSGDTETVGGAGASQTAFVTVPANGAHDLACSADNAGTPSIIGSGSYQVDVDSQIPIASFMTGSGYAATSTQASDPQTASGQNWINGSNAITIGVTGTEPTVESGVQTITCTINDDTADAVTLTNNPGSGTVAANTPFEATFVADTANGWIDGQNAVACQSTTVAGVAGADGQNVDTSSIEYVDVTDASWPLSPGQPESTPTSGQCGISSVIDNGGCAYSNGPSQTAWYSTAQTVQITADDTGAAAPITSITCTGVTMRVSSWTASADPQDVDGNNGMTVTATLEAPGGTLDCSASDSTNPVDAYELGTYNVSIDPDKPTGDFEDQGANGAAANILQLDVSSPGGSGIKQVSIEAKDQNTGKAYTGGELTGNPADGSTAYATLDPATGTYNLTVDPSAFPGLDDKVAFTATAITNAGLTATLSTTASGSSEVLTPVELGQNPNPGLVLSPNGDSTSITGTGRAGKWVATSVTQNGLPASLTASPTSPVTPATVATIAKWSRAVCKPAKKTTSKPARETTKGKPAKKAPKRSCRTVTSRAPRPEELPANYGQKLEVTGTLTDTTTNTPIPGGSVLIYTTNVATGAVRLADTAKTGARGRFGYRLAAGPDRRVDLVYLGTDTTKGVDTAFDTTTAGKLRVSAARTVRVGQHMRITGRILGGSIDGKGALVQMWYRINGHARSWEPFKPGRSTPHGGFVIRYPISAADKGLTYRVRIKIPTQAGWGFRGATSNVLRFHVA